jgi:hypothetical protein
MTRIYHLTMECFERMCQQRSLLADVPDLVNPTPTVSGDVPMTEGREKVACSPDETTYEALRLEEMKIRVDGARVEHARQIAQTEHEDRVRRMELEGIRARQIAQAAHEESERVKDAAANEVLRRATLESGLARLAAEVVPPPTMSDDDWERHAVVALDRVMASRVATVERERERQRNIRARRAHLGVLKERVASGVPNMTTSDVRTAIRLGRRDDLFRIQLWLSQVEGVHALHIRLRGFAAMVAQIFREETGMCDPVKFPSPYGARLDILANHYTVDDLFILERARHIFADVQGRSFYM